jgi:hypothetical protein
MVKVHELDKIPDSTTSHKPVTKTTGQSQIFLKFTNIHQKLRMIKQNKKIMEDNNTTTATTASPMMAVVGTSVTNLITLRGKEVKSGNLKHVEEIDLVLNGIYDAITNHYQSTTPLLIDQIKQMRFATGWFESENEELFMYVAKSGMFIPGIGDVPTFTFIQLLVHGKCIKNGMFDEFLSQFEEMAFSQERVVEIRNVRREWMLLYLEAHGYTKIKTLNKDEYSYYKVKG